MLKILIHFGACKKKYHSMLQCTKKAAFIDYILAYDAWEHGCHRHWPFGTYKINCKPYTKNERHSIWKKRTECRQNERRMQWWRAQNEKANAKRTKEANAAQNKIKRKEEREKKLHSESRKQECWTVAVGRSGFIFSILSVTVEFFWPVSARARAYVCM